LCILMFVVLHLVSRRIWLDNCVWSRRANRFTGISISASVVESVDAFKTLKFSPVTELNPV
jgi:hypothetical protein